jgi:hypothetical protein
MSLVAHRVYGRLSPGGLISITGNNREERKLEKQMGELQHQLSGMRAAAKALGHTAERDVVL